MSKRIEIAAVVAFLFSAPVADATEKPEAGRPNVPFIAGWAKPGKKNTFPIARDSLHNDQIGTVMDLYSTIQI